MNPFPVSRTAVRRAHPRTASRRGRVLHLVLVAWLLAGAAFVGALAVPAANSAQAAPLDSASVRVRVLNVNPLTPTPSDTPRPLTVTLQLVNTTDQTLRELTVRGDRGNPINSQSALDAAIKRPTAPDPFLDSPILPLHDITTTLGAHAAVTVQFQTQTSRQHGDGLCLCADAIYPLYFTVHYAGDAGDTVVGVTQTYLPAFGVSSPRPVQVGWVWPLMDRPHRVTSDTVFTDDDLATSVSTGRLDRALAVIEALGPTAKLTLVIDPELLDELAVMSSGQYQIQPHPNVAVIPGSSAGAAAARSWLTRLSTVLRGDPDLDVRYTIPADPDIETLAQRGLAWANGLTGAEAARVSTALDGFEPNGTLVWPAQTGVHAATLTAALQRGAGGVLLPSTAVTAAPAATSAGVVDLAGIGGVNAPVTIASAATTTAAQNALALNSLAAGALPQLVAQAALPAAVAPDSSSFVAVVAPRYVDPGPATAAAISATTTAFWSTPITLAAASDSFSDRANRLAPAGDAAISPSAVDAAVRTRSVTAVLASMATPQAAATTVAPLGPAVQRVTSSAWITYPADAATAVAVLSARLDSLSGAVHLVHPRTGTYTLASSNSPLPLTVQNDLDFPVQVRIEVRALAGVAGFRVDEVGLRAVAPHTTVTLHVPLHLQRSGRFQVAAQLLSPARQPVGAPVTLSVHSTALGVLGVAITVAAGAVLLIALLVRLVRRIRRGRTPPLAPPTVEP